MLFLNASDHCVMILHTDDAINFINKVISEHMWRRLVHKKYGLDHKSKLSSTDWECFIAILFGEVGGGTTGRDLNQSEVKSAEFGNCFAYHYYKDTGIDKAIDERDHAAHAFISYSPDFNLIEVWRASPGSFHQYFDKIHTTADTQFKTTNDSKSVRFSLTEKIMKTHSTLVLRPVKGQPSFVADLSNVNDAVKKHTPHTTPYVMDIFAELNQK